MLRGVVPLSIPRHTANSHFPPVRSHGGIFFAEATPQERGSSAGLSSFQGIAQFRERRPPRVALILVGCQRRNNGNTATPRVLARCFVRPSFGCSRLADARSQHRLLVDKKVQRMLRAANIDIALSTTFIRRDRVGNPPSRRPLAIASADARRHATQPRGVPSLPRFLQEPRLKGRSDR